MTIEDLVSILTSSGVVLLPEEALTDIEYTNDTALLDSVPAEIQQSKYEHI